MAVFVLDEDMPRSTGRMLSEIGHQVKDIRDYGLRGADDDRIFQFAQDNQAVLLTADLGFGNPLRYARHRHFGIVIARFPNEMTTDAINRLLARQLGQIGDDNYRGNTIVVEPGQIRIRKW